MDLWDLTKLLIRRWYFSAPLLVVTLIAVVFASQSVKPDYSATGQLQMIPPVGLPASDRTTPPGPHNPWLDLGFNAWGQAVVLRINNDEALRDQLEGEGLSDTYTVSLEYATTYFTVEALGTTPAQATQTVQRVMGVIKDEVGSQQSQFGALPRDQVTTLELNRGDNVEAVTSKVKRVVVVAGALALLLTAGLTVAFDAFLRRGSRLRTGRDDLRPSAAGPSDGVLAAPSVPVQASTLVPTPMPVPTPVIPVATPAAPDDPAAEARELAVPATTELPMRVRRDRTEQAESTVVLPLSYRASGRRRDQRG